jgi:hypothetical protein
VPSDLPFNALDELTALVDKSLLRQEAGTDGAPRFVMRYNGATQQKEVMRCQSN